MGHINGEALRKDQIEAWLIYGLVGIWNCCIWEYQPLYPNPNILITFGKKYYIESLIS